MRTRRYKFAYCLITIVAGSLLPLTARSGDEPNSSPIMVNAHSVLSAYAALADQHLHEIAAGLDVLAESQEVKSGDWDTMKGLLASIERRTVPGSLIYCRPDGRFYMVDKDTASANVSDRDYFKKAMMGEEAIGELLVGRTSGRKSVIVAVPVKSDDKVTGVLSASLYLDDFSKHMAESLALPTNMWFAAVASDGRVALHPNPARLLEDARKMNSESLAKSIDYMLSRPDGETRYDLDGIRKRAIFQKSALTDWRYLVGVELGPAE